MADQWEYKVTTVKPGELVPLVDTTQPLGSTLIGYVTLPPEFELALDQWGAQGWELVTVVSNVEGHLGANGGAISTHMTAILKRLKP